MTTWDILIATLCSRTDRLGRLLDVLLPQVDAADGEVHVTAYRNQGERPLAEIRQALVDFSHGEYVCFIDDDDMVPNYYVETVLPLLDGVDHVGWRMQSYVDGEALKPTYHSIRWVNGRHGNEARAAYRGVSHLNPIRTELVRRCDFTRCPPPEDWDWARYMNGLVKTEHYVPNDKIMYHYYGSSGDPLWKPGSAAKRHPGVNLPPMPIITSPNFFLHPRSTC